MDAKKWCYCQSEEHGTVIAMKNVQLASFILIVSKFKISLLEIGIVQTVGRMCKNLSFSGDRLGCKYIVPSIMYVHRSVC